MTKPRAAVRGMPCFLTKESISSVAAVELCSRNVATKPEAHAVKRFFVLREIQRRRDEPYARVKPRLTIRVPKRRRHTAPAMWRNIRDAVTVLMMP